jgi:hypothetical protein
MKRGLVVTNPKSLTIKIKNHHFFFCGGFQTYLTLFATFVGSFSQQFLQLIIIKILAKN